MRLPGPHSFFFFLVLLSTAQACPDGQYNSGFGICLPYGPSVDLGDPECSLWQGNLYYIETVSAMNQVSTELAKAGISDTNSCQANESLVASVVSTYYGRLVGEMTDNLLHCACKVVHFSSLPPPPPEQRSNCQPGSPNCACIPGINCANDSGWPGIPTQRPTYR